MSKCGQYLKTIFNNNSLKNLKEMKNKIEVIEYTLPTYLASFLINGVTDNLTKKEIEEVKNFCKSEGVRFVSVEDDSSFCQHNDLHYLAGDCSTYIAHKINRFN